MLRTLGLSAFAIGVFVVSTVTGMADGVRSVSSVPDKPAFDIQSASVQARGHKADIPDGCLGDAGKETPKAIGKLKGSSVYSYVWPTSFDPSVVGFSRASGILAFAVTSHPDFDDTPWFDEDGDGDAGNDGRIWHSHWVVLTKTKECGPSGLKVRDIAKGETFDLPKTWPNLPILIDSPGWHPEFTTTSVEVQVPFDKTAKLFGRVVRWGYFRTSCQRQRSRAVAVRECRVRRRIRKPVPAGRDQLSGDSAHDVSRMSPPRSARGGSDAFSWTHWGSSEDPHSRKKDFTQS